MRLASADAPHHAGADAVPADVLNRAHRLLLSTGGYDVEAAARAQVAWDRKGGAGRAPVLRAMADALEADLDRLVALLSREAGKTLNDGVAEVTALAAQRGR